MDRSVLAPGRQEGVMVSVPDAFDLYRYRLAVSETKTQVAAARAPLVRTIVAAALPIADAFFIGSYARQTLIEPLHELSLDLALVVGDGPWQSEPALLLERLQAALHHDLPHAPLRPTRHGVTLWRGTMALTVAPLLPAADGAYLLASRGATGWLATNPRAHVQLSRRLDAACDGRLLPLVRILKGWNRASGRLLRAFHLEALVWATLGDTAPSDSSAAARRFFETVQLLQPLPDPAGFGGDLGDYLSTEQRLHVRDRCASAARLLLQAESQLRRGRPDQARVLWREVFGGYFPIEG